MFFSEVERHCKALVTYVGEDGDDKFLECFETELEYIREKLHFREPMGISSHREKLLQEAVNCHLCGFELGADRVSDHCHLIEQFCGAARNECYLNSKFTGRLTGILHNLRGYDSHLIMQGIGKLNNKKIYPIPKNTKRYISFSIDNLDFIDSTIYEPIIGLACVKPFKEQC